MPSTLAIRHRIRSIRSTKQITKAMEMVSAAKMRRASLAAQDSRPYAERLWSVVADLTAKEPEIKHPLLTPVRNPASVLVIGIGSNRGLAGAYDTNVLKAALIAEEGHDAKFIAVGKKLTAALSARKRQVLQSYPSISDHPALADVQPIAQFAIQSFLKGDFQQVILISTHFRSALTQEVIQQSLLPLQPPKDITPLGRRFTYEPSPETVLDSILPQIVEDALYQAFLESVASEQAARRLAMKNATDNAGEIVDDLTLQYNSVRQGAITQELAEISGGVAAMAQS